MYCSNLLFLYCAYVLIFQCTNALKQGFSTFWYLGTPKSRLYPSVYHQIGVVSPSRTPKIKNLTQNFILVVYKILHIPCELLKHPSG